MPNGQVHDMGLIRESSVDHARLRAGGRARTGIASQLQERQNSAVL